MIYDKKSNLFSNFPLCYSPFNYIKFTFYKLIRLFSFNIVSTNGVNLIGYAKHNLGIAEDFKTSFLALKSSGINVSTIAFNPGDLNNRIDNFYCYRASIPSAKETTRDLHFYESEKVLVETEYYFKLCLVYMLFSFKLHA